MGTSLCFPTTDLDNLLVDFVLWYHGAPQEEKAAMKKLGPKLEISPATKRLWQELKQEMVSATTRLKGGFGRSGVVSGVASSRA